MDAPPPTTVRSISESPWYWAYLFCTGGLVALVMIGPKYSQRQADIEQNGQKRQWAAQLAAGRAADDSPNSAGGLSITLGPLYLVLGAILAIAWLKLIRDHFRRRDAVTPPPQANAPAAAADRSVP